MFACLHGVGGLTEGGGIGGEGGTAPDIASRYRQSKKAEDKKTTKQTRSAHEHLTADEVETSAEGMFYAKRDEKKRGLAAPVLDGTLNKLTSVKCQRLWS